MKKLTDKEKSRMGGELARMLGLKLEMKSKKWVACDDLLTSLQIYEAAHQVVCCSRPVRKATCSEVRE
jgi:hypothetical protein